MSSDTPTRPPTASVTLVLGGARSGKSAFAETLLAGVRRPVYLATAEVVDNEMAARIESHRRRRDARWRTVEEPLDLARALGRHCADDAVVLVDCLTVWLGNLMHAHRDLDAEVRALIESLTALAGPAVLVSSEVGWGIVPDNAMARIFRDHAGTLNQSIAARADRVYLTVAGIATLIKGEHARSPLGDV